MKVETINQEIVAPAKPPQYKKVTVDQQATEVERHARQIQNAKSGINAYTQVLNKSIMETSAAVSLSSGNHSLSLLFKSAIEHLNVALEPEFGANAIQNAYDSGVDVSPQATADRIVSMSTAFFGKYMEMHPEKSQETALSDFIKIIGDGINQGFSDARKILDGLSVLNGDIAANVDKTYELVQSGLKAFADNFPPSGKPAA